jgi:hypothetical protein
MEILPSFVILKKINGKIKGKNKGKIKGTHTIF